MSNMCNCQPNSFWNNFSTIRAQYNNNLVKIIPLIIHFSRIKIQQEALTRWQYDISIHKSRDSPKENRISAPNIETHPWHLVANPKKKFGFAKNAKIPMCVDDPISMKLSFIYMRPSRSNYYLKDPNIIKMCKLQAFVTSRPSSFYKLWDNHPTASRIDGIMLK